MVEYQNTHEGRKPLTNGAILAIALALILAAHEVGREEHWTVLGLYFYWAFRIGMSYLIIVGAYTALAQVMTGRSSPVAHAGLAAVLSYPPVVMAVTTLDLLIGDRELLQTQPDVLMTAIGLDAASLIDDHLTTSALLLAPYFLFSIRPTRRGAPIVSAERREQVEDVADLNRESTTPTPVVETPGLLLASQPSVQGELIAAEAQEHYVKLKATEQGGMALYRFGDAVRDLGRFEGLQVHRSHWVADDAVIAVIGKRGSMKLELSNGEIIPVSRRYELEVEARYGRLQRRAD